MRVGGPSGRGFLRIESFVVIEGERLCALVLDKAGTLVPERRRRPVTTCDGAPSRPCGQKG